MVWKHFTEVKDTSRKVSRAKCRKCEKDVVALVVRMKRHIKECVRAKFTDSIYDSSSSNGSSDIEITETGEYWY